MAPRVWYHGSDEERDELEASWPRYSGSLGHGVYLTSDPRFARKFGTYVHEVVDPVPDEEVLWVDPNLWPCGDDLVIGTPGSTPFTFDVEDREDGSIHRYSVLENCEEIVRAQVEADRFSLSDSEAKAVAMEEVRDDLSPAVADWLDKNDGFGELARMLIENPYDSIDTHVDHILQREGLGDLMDEEGYDDLFDILVAAGEGFREEAEAAGDEVLGELAELEDLSGIAESHGYSALYISGYSAGGDELIVFDSEYLPVQVDAVQNV